MTWSLVVLWLSGFLKLFASFVGVLPARPRSIRVGRFAVFCGAGAAALLAGHGLLFVVGGALVESGAVHGEPDVVALRCLRQAADRARIVRHAQVGALGGALVVLLSTLSGLG